jgi:hypothetical protein
MPRTCSTALPVRGEAFQVSREVRSRWAMRRVRAQITQESLCVAPPLLQRMVATGRPGRKSGVVFHPHY